MIEPDEVWWNAIERSRRGVRRRVVLRRRDDRRVLPAGVSEPSAQARERALFPGHGERAARGIARVQALPTRTPRRPATSPRDSWSARAIGSCNQDPLPTPAAFATLSGCSDRTLRRAFKDVLGITPGQYLQALKTQRLRGALRNGERITDALYSAGYGSSGRAYENTARLGMRPSSYTAGGAGIRIEYAMRETAAGWLLAAASASGLCCVRFGESRAALRSTLAEEFPAASLIEAPNEWIEALFDFADGRADWRVLPIDVRGTAFQEKVWRALRKIPSGQTRTYAQVAQAIGLPNSVRAVANACAANPVALAVPCHRVVPKAGGIGGYRWGATTQAERCSSANANASIAEGA